MLGSGSALPFCELIDGQVKYTVVKATYGCGDSEIGYELTHRSQAAPGATLTDHFAVKLTNGSPPPAAFDEALVALVRSREGEFEWVWPGDQPE
jgi:hypothetical protein